MTDIIDEDGNWIGISEADTNAAKSETPTPKTDKEDKKEKSAKKE